MAIFESTPQLDPTTLAYYGSLSAVMLCTIGSIACADRVRRSRKDHRLFVALILFALNWAILLPYYALQTLSHTVDIAEIRNFLPAYSGVLILFTGGALHREAIDRKKEKSDEVGRYDALALLSLSLLVAPHVIRFAPAMAEQFERLLVIVLQPLLTVAGFTSIVIALNILTKDNEVPWLWRTFLVVASAYALADILFSAGLFHRNVESPSSDPMGNLFKWIFAGFKLVFSALFFVIVLRQTVGERKKRLKQK